MGMNNLKNFKLELIPHNQKSKGDDMKGKKMLKVVAKEQGYS